MEGLEYPGHPEEGDCINLKGVLFKKFRKKKSKVEEALALRENEEIPKGMLSKFKIVPNRKFITLPAEKDIKIKSVVYPLIRPYSYANIKWDPVENALVYNVIEPKLSDREREYLKKLQTGLVQVINVRLDDIKNEDRLLEFLEERIDNLIEEYGFKMTRQSYVKVMYFIFRNFIGLNRIEPLLRDPYIEDIGLDGINIPIYVVHQKFGSLKTNIIYKNEREIKEFVTKLAERCDRYISYAEPLLDGSLPDGTRVQATLAGDVTTRGPTFSIRKFKETPFSLVDMIKLGTASAEMLAYLWYVVENGANILIAGGVSTGKTSFLNTICLFIPPESKVVSIEDTRELNIPHENWIPGVARVGFTGTGVGEVSMFELLRESFRQNPDYLIVGEIRGEEAYVMFQSMASGHPSISTIHAGSIDDVMKRLQTTPINLSPGLLESLDMIIIMIHAREKGKSARRVKEVVEVESIDTSTGRARTMKSFVWIPSEDSFEYKGNSWVLNKISTERGVPMNTIIRDISRRKKIINWLYEEGKDPDEIIKYIKLYYRNPEKIETIIEGGKHG